MNEQYEKGFKDAIEACAQFVEGWFVRQSPTKPKHIFIDADGQRLADALRNDVLDVESEAWPEKGGSSSG